MCNSRDKLRKLGPLVVRTLDLQGKKSSNRSKNSVLENQMFAEIQKSSSSWHWGQKVERKNMFNSRFAINHSLDINFSEKKIAKIFHETVNDEGFIAFSQRVEVDCCLWISHGNKRIHGCK